MDCQNIKIEKFYGIAIIMMMVTSEVYLSNKIKRQINLFRKFYQIILHRYFWRYISFTISYLMMAHLWVVFGI